MKLTFLLFFTLVVATMSIEYEEAVERIADFLILPKDEVQTCFNEKNVKLEDLTKLREVAIDDLQMTNTTLKAGCLFACLGQKKEMMTGARINADKIKEIMRSLPEKRRTDKLAHFDQIVDTCANQVKTKTDECEVAVTFVFCMN